MPILLMLTLLIYTLFQPLSTLAAEAVPYEIFSPSKASSEMYKGIPINWHSVYALQEFDAYAPATGSDWTSDHPDRDKKTGLSPARWLEAAKQKGWATATDLPAAEVGALLLLADRDGAYAAVITEVHPDGLYYKMPNIEGLPSKFWLSFADKTLDGYRLNGLIYPRHSGIPSPYSQAASSNPTTTATPPADYKNFPAGSAAAVLLAQFDAQLNASIAWTGNPTDWIQQAEQHQLDTSYELNAAKVGALLISQGRNTDVQLVKAVYPDRLVVAQVLPKGLVCRQISLKKLTAFAAYIYPPAAQPQN